MLNIILKVHLYQPYNLVVYAFVNMQKPRSYVGKDFKRECTRKVTIYATSCIDKVLIRAILWLYTQVRRIDTFFEEKKIFVGNVYFEGIIYLRTGTFLEV